MTGERVFYAFNVRLLSKDSFLYFIKDSYGGGETGVCTSSFRGATKSFLVSACKRSYKGILAFSTAILCSSKRTSNSSSYMRLGLLGVDDESYFAIIGIIVELSAFPSVGLDIEAAICFLR